MSTMTETMKAWAARDVVGGRRARAAVAAAAFVSAVAFGAQVAVPLPFTPVPATLQTLFVVLAGVVLGPRLGATAMLGYLAAGAAGAPVFSNGAAGLPWLFGPTGGYLLAAPAAAFLAGTVSGRDVPMLRTLGGLTLGVLTMYAGGTLQLWGLSGGSLEAALALGVAPFVVGDAVKVCAAFWLARLTRGSSFDRL